MSNMDDFVIENGVLKKYEGPGGPAEKFAKMNSIPFVAE